MNNSKTSRKIAKINALLYHQLIPDDILTVATTKNGLHKMCLLDYKHRIPGVLFITTDESTFTSFTDLLKMAMEIIDHEPGETICCDTDMDSYRITPIFDLFHDEYPELPNNPLTETHAGRLTPNPTFLNEDIRYMALIIEPLDYHS